MGNFSTVCLTTLLFSKDTEPANGLMTFIGLQGGRITVCLYVGLCACLGYTWQSCPYNNVCISLNRSQPELGVRVCERPSGISEWQHPFCLVTPGMEDTRSNSNNK